MKRLRVLGITFDARPTALGTVVEDDCEPRVKDQWTDNQANLRSALQAELGSADWDRKERDFIELGQAPWSIVYPGVDEIREIRNTFATGNYRAAAAAAGGAGERLLNQLVKHLRDDFDSPSVQLARGWSTKWGPLVTALREWDVFDDTLVDHANRLVRLRNEAVHRGPTDDGRSGAIAAHDHLRAIVEGVLGAHVPTRWFIQSHASEPFIAKAYEDHPVVLRYYVPVSAMVGPWHELDLHPTRNGINVTVKDDYPYEEREVTDDEYVNLRRQSPPAPGA